MARVPEGQEEMMDFCSENEIQFYEMDRPCLTKAALPGLTQEDAGPHWACQLGIQVRISQKASAKGFRKAAIIVVAIEKMKKTSPGSLFTDKDLMDILNTVLEPVKFDTNRCTQAVSSIYQFSEEICCDIQDIAQKSLVLQKPPPQLLAMFLQGPNIKHAVKLKMSIYRPKPGTNGEKTPTALNIKGSNLYLSCVQKDGQPPLLQLEEATLRGDLDQATLGRFLFYRVHGAHTRFESALFPGWFICTSARSEAVGITDQPGGAWIVDYDLTG